MKKQIRVLWHLPYGMVGGVETLYATIIKYLDDPFIENYISCITKIQPWVRRKYSKYGSVLPFDSIPDLISVLRTAQPDVIIGTHGLMIYNALSQSKMDIPVIEIVHGSHIWSEHNVFMPKNFTKHIVYVSNTAKSVMESHTNYDIDSSIIVNGVDTQIFRPMQELKKAPKILGYFGRFLESDKHITKMIQAFRQSSRTGTTLNLIGGTPSEIIRLKHFARALRIEERIEFTPPLDYPVVKYAEVDIATVRSEAEGYCNSAAEALATGTPLVCYDFGGILTHVDPGTIRVCSSQAEYTQELGHIFQDFEARKSMRKKGLSYIEKKGNAKIMSKKYLKLIRSVTKFSKKPNTRVAAKSIHNSDSCIVGVYNPNWHGIATATKSIVDYSVHWNKSVEVMVTYILATNPTAVLFSGMCPGFDKVMLRLRNIRPKIKIYSYYHGGISHYSFKTTMFGTEEYKAFDLILQLHKKGVIDKIAVSSPGLDYYLNANGYKAEFCGNIRLAEKLPPVSLMRGLHIGNWNRNHDHKHTTIGIGAAQILGAKVHCIGIPTKIPGMKKDYIISHKEMRQDLLFSLYQTMTVNLQMSFVETFNISVLEMWAAGRPVIISPSNYVLVKGNKTLESLIPKDPTDAHELSKLILKATENTPRVISEQFKQLNKNNKESKSRWNNFFNRS